MANANTNLVTSNGTTFLVITTDTANSSVLVDYSTLLGKIANSSSNSATAAAAAPNYSSYFDTWSGYWLRLVQAAERIANSAENIESHQLNIRNDIHHLRILGDHNGSGIRTTTPYGWLTNAYYYKWFITQGHIYESEFDVDTANLALSISKMNEYMGDMGNNFPSVYSYGGYDTDEQPLSTPPH